MSIITNFDELKRLHEEAKRYGPGSKQWLKFAEVFFDSFSAIYETAKRSNAKNQELYSRLSLATNLLEDATDLVVKMNDDDSTASEFAYWYKAVISFTTDPSRHA